MASLKMLAVDLGASSGRGIVGRFDGERLTLEENHRFPNEPVILNGEFHWDILRLYHEVKQAIRQCALSEDRDIATIGIDTWGVDYGLLGRRGQLLGNPYHYRDGRTEKRMGEVFSKLPRETLYRISGIQTMAFNTVFQLAAEQGDHPEMLAAAEKLLFTPDLLNYFLTGKAETEYTIASTSGLLDAGTRDWSGEIRRTMGFPDRIFCPIRQPGTVVGPLLPQVLEEVGPIHAQVVHVGAHDTASAVVAVPAKGNDFVYISSGTWSLMGCELDQPCRSELAARYDFTNEGGAAGKIRFLKNIMGLWLEQESRRQWAREGIQVSFDELSRSAMASKPLQSIVNPDDPVFSPPGNMPGRIAEYCRKTGQHVPENRGEIVRCIFDSLALRYRWTVEKIDEIRGSRTPFINIVGGGTKEAPLCQLAADACGRPVYAGPVEATAIGNLALQAMAMGELKTLDEVRHVVRHSFEIRCYEPAAADAALWDDGYARFCRLIGE